MARPVHSADALAQNDGTGTQAALEFTHGLPRPRYRLRR